MDTPRTPEKFYKMFGRFSYIETQPPTGAIINVDRKWQRNIVPIDFAGKKIWGHRAVKDSLESIWTQWTALRHPYKVIFSGCYNPRHQMNNPKKPLSIHSWGAAIDLNAQTNLPGKPGDLPDELVSLFENEGWNWGGRWKAKDAMHFQMYNGKSF